MCQVLYRAGLECGARCLGGEWGPPLARAPRRAAAIIVLLTAHWTFSRQSTTALQRRGSMVLLLNPEQIATFKREGFLLLPGALDPDACDRAREQMWGELCAAVPRLDPHDSTTWCHFTDSEIPSQRRSEAEFNNSYDGGDPRLDISKGDRFNLHNGCDELQINTFFHPLLAVAEQLLGTGEVLVPGGVGNNGLVSGPFFADGLSEATRAIHTAKEPRWPVPNKTETVALDPSAGCVSTLIGQGTRGIYGTLPAKDPGAHDSSAARRDWDGSAGTHNKEGAAPTGLHSDVGLSFPGRVMLRAVAFVGDCPPGSGGFVSLAAQRARPSDAELSPY
eukprot:COSAG05_NODE_694_length_7891_cov_5.305570_3_plen_334_part_00